MARGLRVMARGVICSVPKVRAPDLEASRGGLLFARLGHSGADKGGGSNHSRRATSVDGATPLSSYRFHSAFRRLHSVALAVVISVILAFPTCVVQKWIRVSRLLAPINADRRDAIPSADRWSRHPRDRRDRSSVDLGDSCLVHSPR